MRVEEPDWTQDSSISVAISNPSVWGMNVGGSGVRMIHDAHNQGAIAHCIGYSLMYAVVNSCIMELQHSLDANEAGTWKNTVVYVSGDFGRNQYPSQDAPMNGGTDHERNGQVASIFSGAINGPICVGNLIGTEQSGRGGITKVGSNSVRLIPVHTANTIAAILGTDQPVRNAAEPLVVAASNGTFNLRADVDAGKAV